MIRKLLFLCLLHTASLVYGMENPSDQANTFLDQHNLLFQLGRVENDSGGDVVIYDEDDEELDLIEDEKSVFYGRKFSAFQHFQRMDNGIVRFATLPLSFFIDFEDEEEIEADLEELLLQVACIVRNNVCQAVASLFKELPGGQFQTLQQSQVDISLSPFSSYTARLDVTIDSIFENSELVWKIQDSDLEGGR